MLRRRERLAYAAAVALTLAVLVAACSSSGTSATTGAASSSSGAAGVASAIDLTRLPLGDQAYASSPTRDRIWACRQQRGQGGAQAEGPWLNGDGTWDETKKVYVDGDVHWDAAHVSFAVQGDQRVITSNALPDHGTGVFPIAATDDAYQYDRNPNTITPQSLSISVPASPAVAAGASCIGGEVGIATDGVPIFNGFDAGGRDAVAHEVQDHCHGHPQDRGVYHYHDVSACLDPAGTGPSPLVGYAFDGFGIYGNRDADGRELTNADLDECHGTTSVVTWEGKQVSMYHYVATHEFPYTVGCFRGTVAQHAPLG